MPSSSHRAKHPLNHESSPQLPVHFTFRPTNRNPRPTIAISCYVRRTIQLGQERSTMSDAIRQFRLPPSFNFRPHSTSQPATASTSSSSSLGTAKVSLLSHLFQPR